MRKSRITAAFVGLLAVMLVVSVVASAASAALAPGPFWHHRAKGGTGEGAKIGPNAPENFRGAGGRQILTETIGTTEVEIESPSTQVKGAIFNAVNQGQAKVTIAYSQPRLEKPELKGCAVTLGERNIVQAKGHLMWKWNGINAQLLEGNQEAAGQTPDLVLSGVEPQPATKELKEGSFTTVTISGSGCGVLASKQIVTGSDAGFSNRNVEEWSSRISIAIPASPPGGFFQHFWNGSSFTGVSVGLLCSGKPCTYLGVGQTEIESEQQEIAVFEN